MRIRHRFAILLALGLFAATPVVSAAQENDPSRDDDQRVVIFGIDGADAAMVERLMKAGKLPNFTALAKRGSYHRLATTNPAQSPVSWAAFSTGSNPGKTAIFDFLRRDVDVPGKIEISLAGKEWGPPPGIPAGNLRPALPWAGGALIGLLGMLLAGLALRMMGIDEKKRRRAAVIVGLALAVATGFAMARFLRWVPESVPRAVSYRRGVPLWTVLGQEGVKTVAIEAPISFPADRADNLRLLTGLGTPDVQGHWGFYSVFTEDGKTDDVTPETGGFVDQLVFDDDGVARSRVYGPQDLSLGPDELRRISDAAMEAQDLYNFKVGVPSAKRREERVWQHARRAKHSSMVLEVRRGSDGVYVRLGSGGPRPVLNLPVPEDVRGPTVGLPKPGDPTVNWGTSVKLKLKEWSDRVAFEFRMNPILKVSGLGRFWLENDGSDGEPLRLILSPVQFDPSDVPPVVELSWPREFAPSLAAKIGAYDTLGWPCLTNPVKDELLTDEAFVAHTRLVLEGRRKKLREMLADKDWKCLFMLFSEVDRVQHAMWRHIDPENPLYDPEAAKEFGGAIDEFYIAMDDVLGEIVESVGPEARVVVMSDHGFSPFRRGVNINTWLIDKGLMAGEQGDARNVNQLFEPKDFFAGVDWAKTKAYAMGLGHIYINLNGREVQGSVPEDQYDAVVEQVRRGLLALRDHDGKKVVREVYRGRDIYKGDAVRLLAPDLVVGFERGYRVSWQTTLGGGGAAVIENNRFRWSGDHCSVDPSLVPGILLSSEPLDAEGSSVMDIAPTVLDWFGIKPPGAWDGRSLRRR